MVVQHLIPPDLADPEISRLGMREVPTADRAGRDHRIALGQMNAGVLLGLQQIEQQPLFRMVRARRIPWRGTDPPVLLTNQLLVREMLVLAVSPLFPHPLMKILGERL